VIIAGRGRLPHLFYTFHAEVIACLHELQSAVDLGIGRVILETESVSGSLL
jgi:hypothetical protein